MLLGRWRDGGREGREEREEEEEQVKEGREIGRDDREGGRD